MDEANSGVGGAVLEKQNDGTMYDVIKKYKGVKSRVVKNKIMSADYEQCYKNKTKMYHKMNVIRSRKHIVYSETLNKKSLSHEDDKRAMIPGSYQTYAIGYYKTRSGGSSVS